MDLFCDHYRVKRALFEMQNWKHRDAMIFDENIRIRLFHGEFLQIRHFSQSVENAEESSGPNGSSSCQSRGQLFMLLGLLTPLFCGAEFLGLGVEIPEP